MNSEEKLLNKWRNLPTEKQQEVIDFVEFIELRMLQDNGVIEDDKIEDTKQAKSNLGERLRAIREKAIASGIKLLNVEEIEQERKERQGGYQGD